VRGRHLAPTIVEGGMNWRTLGIRFFTTQSLNLSKPRPAGQRTC